MAEFSEADEYNCSSYDSAEVEIVSEEEFKMIDAAIQDAVMQEIKSASDENNATSIQTKTELLTPLDKFRGGLGYLSVSDLTAQFWCEQQMEYNFLAPEPKPQTKQMQLGKDIHLARELELHDVEDIKIESKEDKWATVFLDCLTKMALLDARQTVRELSVFGEPFQMGAFVYGIIDELHFNEKGQLELLELKTRAGNYSLPSKAQQNKNFLQTKLYSIMLNDLLAGKLNTPTLLSKFHLNGNAALSEDVVKFARELRIPCVKLIQIADVMLNRFQTTKIPKISSVVVEYCSQVSQEVIHRTCLELDECWAHSKLIAMLPYWTGERETVGVEIEEAWKCHQCEFADACTWRMKKDVECRKLK